ncbi:MAG TPA: hypothetical protein VMS21_11980 [Methylomirabilota bacterium]|nr:hypothetical protein [Methylomirabilota bacterium]
MSERAQVTSIESLESFRASLIVFMNKARPALEEVHEEILRTRQWLDHEQRGHWEREVRRRSRLLEQARLELFTARLSQLHTESSAQQMTFRRAKLAFEEAEEKLARVRKWSRELENRTALLLREINQAHTFVTSDLTQAVAHLSRVLQTLEAYSKSGAPMSPAGPQVPAASPDAAEIREDAPATTVHSEARTRDRETGEGDSR